MYIYMCIYTCVSQGYKSLSVVDLSTALLGDLDKGSLKL